MDAWEIEAVEAVRRTMAAYNFGGDRGRIDELVATFDEGGALRIGDEAPVVGRAAILARLGESIQLDPVPRFVHHHVTGLHLRSVAPDAIETASYFQVLTDAGLDHWGRYRDRLVPADGGWLFAQRQILADGFASNSCFMR